LAVESYRFFLKKINAMCVLEPRKQTVTCFRVMVQLVDRWLCFLTRDLRHNSYEIYTVARLRVLVTFLARLC